ncbi:cytochrome C oxidase subunit I [Solimicrobium silvestre]|uniref:SCO family protein n=1 Tax=Solimicrobium silvestre TaxID=2099400 RepID=UPI00311A9582
MNEKVSDTMTNPVNKSANEHTPQQIHRGRWKLYLVIAICASPLFFSYLTYYVIKPTGRTNYGTLLDPRLYPMPKLDSQLQGSGAQELDAYKGKWIMLQVSASDCQAACKKSLLNMRQLRLMQGKDMDRIERVLVITDQNPMETSLLREYDGTHVLRADAKNVEAWLPAEQGSTMQDRLYLIDPLGNLMMRYSVDADPYKIKKDLDKLLKASSIG